MFDSNIVLHLLDEPIESPLARAIRSCRDESEVRINPVILAEISPRFTTVELLVRTCEHLKFSIEPLQVSECYRAGQAHAEYRRRGGEREAILADFLIGAQAEIRGWPLVTRDRKGFASYFPDLKIIDPLEDEA